MEGEKWGYVSSTVDFNFRVEAQRERDRRSSLRELLRGCAVSPQPKEHTADRQTNGGKFSPIFKLRDFDRGASREEKKAMADTEAGTASTDAGGRETRERVSPK